MTQMTAFVPGQTLRFSYRNYRGVTSVREVRPVCLRWGTSDYYVEPQWLMKALDFDRGEFREFAVRNMDCEDMDRPAPKLPLLRKAGGRSDAG